MPKRLQRKRTAGYRLPAEAVCVDRSTKWGNPFAVGKDCKVIPGRVVQDRRHAVALYRGFAPQNAQLVAEARAELAGKDLACWCRLCDLHAAGKPFAEDCPWCEPCHVDVLGPLANDPRKDET